MEKFIVDNGRGFDFGKTSKEYAKYRDIYPEELFQRLHEIGIGVKDLTTHYFDEPKMDTMIVDLPFTRDTWHGRMMASRGVMASMDENKIAQFDQQHRAMLEEKYPEEFTVKHKIFLTWYYL